MTATHDISDYALRFVQAQAQASPEVDAFERQCGYAVERGRLESAAQVLACPVKVNLPSWQHGRVIYAAARRYLAGSGSPVTMLDIGTAKGFSALCLLWALQDSGRYGEVHSCDVIDPLARVLRNTVAEVQAGPLTLAETLEPWPEATSIAFHKTTGRLWLTRYVGRVHVAFVDGKHNYDEVSWEATLLAQRQKAGDLAIFDDLQIPQVFRAVSELTGYDLQEVTSAGGRRYAIGRKR